MRFSALLICLLLIGGLISCKNHAQVSQARKQAIQPVSQPGIVAVKAKSCTEFVQGFYDWYFDRLNTERTRQLASPDDEVLTLKPQLFTSELRKMLHDDAIAASKNPGEIVGLDFDPFINAQDWEGKYWVDKVYIIDETCHANVWGLDAGKKVDIVDPSLIRINNNWIFVDFFYPEYYPANTGRKDASLMGILTDLRVEREHAMNKQPHK